MVKGFADATIKPYGIFMLVVELVSSLNAKVSATRQLDFIVIDLPSTFNGFLGIPFEHEFKAAT